MIVKIFYGSSYRTGKQEKFYIRTHEHADVSIEFYFNRAYYKWEMSRQGAFKAGR